MKTPNEKKQVQAVSFLKRELCLVTQDTLRTYWIIFRVMVPLIIIIELLKQLDAIQYFALPLEPVMQLMGLPAATGLVWATAMVATMYNAVFVYIALLPELGTLSVAQVTVLSLLMLVAHTLPLELKIVQQAGASLRQQCFFRVAGALLIGFLSHHLFLFADILQEPAVLLFDYAPPPEGFVPWLANEVKNLALLFVICFLVLLTMRILTLIKVTDLLGYLLRPLLHIMGMSKNAAGITVVGLALGITYGSGLIINEARKGQMSKSDIFSATTFMGLSHAVIEDTMFLALIGASTLGTFWLRLTFSLLAVAILSRIFFSKATVNNTASAEKNYER